MVERRGGRGERGEGLGLWILAADNSRSIMEITIWKRAALVVRAALLCAEFTEWALGIFRTAEQTAQTQMSPPRDASCMQ